jgi:chemotaxis protein histidine kinase CheA
MENIATYSEARSEYTKQLATFIVPALVTWFQQLWTRNSSDKQRCLALFQGECEEVARWNTDRVHDEVRVLLERTGCDYMEELMTAVFVAHTKVLTAVRLSAKEKKLSITVPKLDHFIHRVFRETARHFWKSPFLFMENSTNIIERQKNVLQIEAMATEAITSAVRSLLPVKQILKDYMGDEQEEIEDTAEATTAEANEVVPAAAEADEEKKPKEEKPEENAPEPVAEDKEAKEAQAKEAKAEEKPAAPAVINIDTEEASVKFSDYDDVVGNGDAELRFAPKGDDDDEDFTPSDGVITVNETSAKSLDTSDAEDLDAPAPKPKPSFSEAIDADDVEVLN